MSTNLYWRPFTRGGKRLPTDYSKPLEVMWLCLEHHRAWHRVFLADNYPKLEAGETK